MLYTYFILDEVSGHIKIGRAKNVHNRLSGLQADTENKLSLLAWVPFSEYYTEQALHKRFKHLQVRTGQDHEWFRPDDELLMLIRQLPKPTGKVRSERLTTALAIKELHQAGKSFDEIGKMFSVLPVTIEALVSGT